MKAKGSVLKYGDNVDTDVIIPARYLNTQDAKELASRLKGINCHVNLIPLNHVEERHLTGVTRRDAEQFASWLQGYGTSATVRREMGSDIDGACGQLRRKTLQRERKAAKER